MNTMKSLPTNLDKSFDDSLLKLNHYQLYPEMLPFIGSHFSKMNKRILVIGESHYLKPETDIHHDADVWYAGIERKKFVNDDVSWIDTRGVAGSGVHQSYGARSHSIFRNIEYAIKEVLEGSEPYEDNYLRYVAYYNYFQRPAQTSVSLSITDLDRQVAYKTLRHLVDTMNVNTLAFVSKLAFHSFLDSNGVEDFASQDIFGTAHPTCSWWNRKHRHYRGKDVHRMTSRDWFVENLGDLRLRN